jgi:NAD(P)-dependent dehydrogenase (short-subunit alcohol dehydrogenase family)
VAAPDPEASHAARFAGRSALVTGAASGIGRATALRLAREGARIAAVDVDAAGAARVVEEIRARAPSAAAHSFECDVSDAAAVARTVAGAAGALGTIDVLANVAGIGDTAASTGLEAIDAERWDRVLAVNLRGPFLLCRAVLPAMVALGKGAIVNVSSLAGRSKSAMGGPAYSASKAGLLGLTRHLAFDYGPRGIRVNAICPGGVDTPMLRAGGARAAGDEAEARARDERRRAYEHFMPIKRLSTPDEQAAAIAFLASDDASYINGVALDVNGGLFMA